MFVSKNLLIFIIHTAFIQEKQSLYHRDVEFCDTTISKTLLFTGFSFNVRKVSIRRLRKNENNIKFQLVTRKVENHQADYLFFCLENCTWFFFQKCDQLFSWKVSVEGIIHWRQIWISSQPKKVILFVMQKHHLPIFSKWSCTPHKILGGPPDISVWNSKITPSGFSNASPQDLVGGATSFTENR